MTFQELRDDIMSTLNYTSSEASTRVMNELIRQYRRVTSSLGLVTARRTRVSQNATIGNRDIVFSGIEKVDVVFRIVGTTVKRLKEISNDEMLIKDLVTEPPQYYSIRSTTSTTVTVRLDCTPTTQFTLYAEGLATHATPALGDTPTFAASFHDILLYAVLTDEYRKLRDFEHMRDAKENYDERLSDLKMFIAKSGYLDIYQGKVDDENKTWWETTSSNT